MILNLKTLGLWLCHFFALILLPLSWIYALFLDKDHSFLQLLGTVFEPDSFLDVLLFLPLGSMASFFLLLPLFYMFIVMFYSLSTGNPFSHLAFSYIKGSLYLKKEEFFYNQLFEIFGELFPNDFYQNQRGTYEVDYVSSNRNILIKFKDAVLKEILHFRLNEQSFFIETTKGNQVSRKLRLKDHDVQLYQTYYHSLVAHFTEIETKQKEKERLIQIKEQEKQQMNKEKEQIREEELLDKLLSTVILMRKRRISYLELSKEEDVYGIQLDKRTIVVTKNGNDVFLKCTYAAGKPIVYLQNEPKVSKNYQKVVAFYANVLSKSDHT